RRSGARAKPRFASKHLRELSGRLEGLRPEERTKHRLLSTSTKERKAHYSPRILQRIREALSLRPPQVLRFLLPRCLLSEFLQRYSAEYHPELLHRPPRSPALPQSLPRSPALPQSLPRSPPRSPALPQSLPRSPPRSPPLPQSPPRSLPRSPALPRSLPRRPPRSPALPRSPLRSPARGPPRSPPLRRNPVRSSALPRSPARGPPRSCRPGCLPPKIQSFDPAVLLGPCPKSFSKLARRKQKLPAKFRRLELQKAPE